MSPTTAANTSTITSRRFMAGRSYSYRMDAVCVMFMVPNIAGRISGTTVWNCSVTVADTTWSGAQGDAAQVTPPVHVPEPRIESILAPPAVLTESGAATTPARTPSRAAAVARLRVSQARLSSTIEKRTKRSTGSTTTNSRVDVPRLLTSLLIAFMITPSRAGHRGKVQELAKPVTVPPIALIALVSWV